MESSISTALIKDQRWAEDRWQQGLLRRVYESVHHGVLDKVPKKHSWYMKVRRDSENMGDIHFSFQREEILHGSRQTILSSA